MRTRTKITLALGSILIVVLVLAVLWVLPVSMEVGTRVTHWGNVPPEEKAEVIAIMEREQDVFRATFDQRGRDISLGLMVPHPMSRERAEHLAQTFMDGADQFARQYVTQYVENTSPSDIEPHRYTIRVFSKNEASQVGTTPEGEFTILEWER